MFKDKANGMSSVFRKVIASFIILGIAASLCSCSGNSNTKVTRKTLSSEELEAEAIKSNNAKVRKFIKEKLGFQLDDEYIDQAELMFDSVKNDSRGSVCIVVKPGKENDLLALLEKNIGMEKNIAPTLIPAELNNEYANDLRTMDLIKCWEPSGASVYMARKSSYSFLYIFA